MQKTSDPSWVKFSKLWQKTKLDLRKWGAVWSCKLKDWCGHFFFSCQQEIREKQRWERCNIIRCTKIQGNLIINVFSFSFCKVNNIKMKGQNREKILTIHFTKWERKEKTLFKQWVLPLSKHSEQTSGKKSIGDLSSRCPLQYLRLHWVEVHSVKIQYIFFIWSQMQVNYFI